MYGETSGQNRMVNITHSRDGSNVELNSTFDRLHKRFDRECGIARDMSKA